MIPLAKMPTRQTNITNVRFVGVKIKKKQEKQNENRNLRVIRK